MTGFLNREKSLIEEICEMFPGLVIPEPTFSWDVQPQSEPYLVFGQEVSYSTLVGWRDNLKTAKPEHQGFLREDLWNTFMRLEPEPWQYLDYQVGGVACSQRMVYGVTLKPSYDCLVLLGRLHKAHYGCTQTGLSDLVKIQNLLQETDSRLSIESSFREVTEAFLPLDQNEEFTKILVHEDDLKKVPPMWFGEKNNIDAYIPHRPGYEKQGLLRSMGYGYKCRFYLIWSNCD